MRTREELKDQLVLLTDSFVNGGAFKRGGELMAISLVMEVLLDIREAVGALLVAKSLEMEEKPLEDSK